MIVTLVLALLFPILLIYFFKNAYKKPKNFPPGPPSLPVYGAFWIVLANGYDDLANAFRKLGERYKTKLLGLYLGSVRLIMVNDPTLIKEVLNRQEFDGRMDIIQFRLRSYWKKLGILFTDGYFWHVQRRFTFRVLRDYGFGRRDSTLETVMDYEIKEMLDMASNGPEYSAEKEIVNGDLVYMPYLFCVPFTNGILHVLSRSTLPRAEYKQLWSLCADTFLFQRASNDIGGALALTPWLKDIIPKYSGYDDLVKGNRSMQEFFEKMVEDNMRTYDKTYARHFLDVYVSKMREEFAEQESTTFSVHQLILTCVDYMVPAASIVQFVLTMLVERLLLQPEIQANIHEEIDRIVGKDRLPSLDDRRNMPYLEACIRETMRYDTMIPLGIGHRAMKDTTLGDYDVPEDTMISANLTLLHTDEAVWGDPQKFRPERFIKNGQIDLASDKSLPFGAGRRLCPGETYARQTMFQVFAAFMQTFQVTTADDKPLIKPSERIQGIITTIPEFWVRITPRN